RADSRRSSEARDQGEDRGGGAAQGPPGPAGHDPVRDQAAGPVRRGYPRGEGAVGAGPSPHATKTGGDREGAPAGAAADRGALPRGARAPRAGGADLPLAREPRVKDVETEFHESWLGMVQPTDGLVVS